MFNKENFNNKCVFITGHTGFKGSWLVHILTGLGAKVTGYALEPTLEPNLFSISRVKDKMTSFIGDIRDREKLLHAFQKAKPEIVIHMAAQPIVRDSYKDPAYTYDVNVMGTVNILECVRLSDGVKSFLNVTTDKVYQNNEWHWGYRETDRLDGYDPYSNSKSCSELVTGSYKNAFFTNGNTAISTARAGNVIGGGDFSADRIIPDCVRAAMNNEIIAVRNPHSIRPYQHVLEPLFAYLMIVQKQYDDGKYAGCYNVGPDDIDCVTTGYLTDCFCKSWGEGLSWKNESSSGPHEANFLKLDCSKLKATFGWKPRWNVNQAVDKTVEWTRAFLTKDSVCDIMNNQIEEYLNTRE
ncbi:MAG: CDP-glucose 4,6-dehydratase [Oscillospiraceae bacterium]|nr:CDP-glucose 4,6-dehydratase [Oscillospiraceae bacterium]